MSRSLIPAQHKLAEKLTILNHRGVGMLTRIYNIKKVQLRQTTYFACCIYLPAEPGNVGEIDIW